MKVRVYTDNDRDDVISLWNECGLVQQQNDPLKDIDRKLGVDPGLFLVGVHENAIVATVMGGYEGHRGWINYLAVRPVDQRKGFGRVIMQAVEECLQNKGCPKINLQIRTSNQDVVSFYEAIGYNVDKVVCLGKRLVSDFS